LHQEKEARSIKVKMKNARLYELARELNLTISKVAFLGGWLAEKIKSGLSEQETEILAQLLK